jgi:hypothetical protein
MSGHPYSSLDDVAAWARALMQRRPDFIIGEPETPYMLRWWVVPRNEHQNVYLHQIVRDDDDRALHDHPWANTSLLLIGRYREITPDGTFVREAGSLVSRPAEAMHRLELIDGEPCVSLFFTGPKTREWGFDCPNGWVPWQQFTGGAHGELVGRGCE